MKVRSNLGHAYHGAGDFERSIATLEPLVAQCAQVFGDSHPGTLTVAANLANSYRDYLAALALVLMIVRRSKRRRARGAPQAVPCSPDAKPPTRPRHHHAELPPAGRWLRTRRASTCVSSMEAVA